MPFSPIDWHNRYGLQARWTRDLRFYLYEKASIREATRLLDVGCGTGVLEAELSALTKAEIHALDIDFANLAIAPGHAQNAIYTQGDAHTLPYDSDIFDICLCHFLLLWVNDPVVVLGEMRRVTRRGGSVLVIAEPDYGGRIDYPPELAQLGMWQTASLRIQGADPLLGRRLAQMFIHTGFQLEEIGIIGGRWISSPSLDEWSSELEILRYDLGFLNQTSEMGKTSEELMSKDAEARARGDRILYVPTFFAWGRVINNYSSTGTPISI